MSSLHHRYRNGEREAVWNEIRQLGPVPDPLLADVDAVATETMRRVAAHVRRLAGALAELGLASSDPSGPLHQPPTTDELADLDLLEREIGGLPAVLRACMREVGTVWFAGDCSALGLHYRGIMPDGVLPDPLCVLGTEFLRSDWDERRDELEPGEPFYFGFAPDECHKANYSGAEQFIELPQAVADPVLHGVSGRRDVTLVEYLRMSIAWGGCPGWEFSPAAPVPAALEALRSPPDF
jgi:hypothetical protein